MVVPLYDFKNTFDVLCLLKDNLLCDASLSLIQLLANAGDHSETILQGMSHLLANQLSGTQACIQSELAIVGGWE